MSAKRDARIAEIYSYLTEHNYASVSELEKLFNVSKATIKRDIDLMSKKNMTERVRGGIMINLTHEDPTYTVRRHMNMSAKALIAQRAAQFIKDEDVVLIMSGSTCFELYKAISSRNVTVFSLNPEILLTKNPNVSHLYVLEGEVSPEYAVIDGSLTLENLSRITPDKVFFTASLSEDYVLQCRTDRELAILLALGKKDIERVYMADKSKIRKRQTFSAFPLDQVDIFVTDIDMEPAVKERYEAAGVHVEKVDTGDNYVNGT